MLLDDWSNISECAKTPKNMFERFSAANCPRSECGAYTWYVISYNSFYSTLVLTLEDMLRAEDDVAREIRELSTPSDPSRPPSQREKFSLSFG